MADYVSPDAIKAARKADLYEYLTSHHWNDVVVEGNSLRLRNNRSVTLRRGYSGWRDWATDESGNGIDLLQNYFGYTFQDAVMALAGGPIQTPHVPQNPPKAVQTVFTPPQPLQGSYRQLYAYMTITRGIPGATVQYLIDAGILYQSESHANAVFINPARTFYEIRGTNTYKPYHQVQFADPAAFWWIKTRGINTDPTVAFICEASIDAVSLYLLHQASGYQENALYCAIGGVANQQRIDAIKTGMGSLPTYIAVDNDAAGEKCRQKNRDCPAIVPHLNDWNDDWRALKEGQL